MSAQYDTRVFIQVPEISQNLLALPMENKTCRSLLLVSKFSQLANFTTSAAVQIQIHSSTFFAVRTVCMNVFSWNGNWPRNTVYIYWRWADNVTYGTKKEYNIHKSLTPWNFILKKCVTKIQMSVHAFVVDRHSSVDHHGYPVVVMVTGIYSLVAHLSRWNA